MHVVWSIGATRGALSKIVIEIAGNAGLNTFGLYDLSNAGNRLEIFAGEASAGNSRTV